jgi:hypothetical protein
MSSSELHTPEKPLLLGLSPGMWRGKRGQPAVEPVEATDSADGLFKSGRFAEAGKLYAEAAARDPEDWQAALRLGEIALRVWLEGLG